MSEHGFWGKLDKSALLTVIGIVILFSSAIIVTLITPGLIDPSWTEPSSDYQVQMYEVADPHTYISVTVRGETTLEVVNHLKNNYTLLAFSEDENKKIVSNEELEKYITPYGEKEVKLTSRLLLLRKPTGEMLDLAAKKRNLLKAQWEIDTHAWEEGGGKAPYFEILELYDPKKEEVFSIARSDGVTENWIDKEFHFIDSEIKQGFHKESGVVYIRNPEEYLISETYFGDHATWQYDENGRPVVSLEELTGHNLGFISRKELINLGEKIVAWNGCWYCHTEQTRTLIQDTVLNGSDSFPAPPSSANEYIYQDITFMGTRRIGPDLSRSGVKRPSRDWNKSHFWSPKTASPGSIMPAFRFFFDDDPRGTKKTEIAVPNYKFEAVYQWLMTKGTRITAPTEAWWIGKDPVRTIDIIEGKKS
jgi:cytochrome c oxidase cbb3-type subunit II